MPNVLGECDDCVFTREKREAVWPNLWWGKAIDKSSQFIVMPPKEQK